MLFSIFDVLRIFETLQIFFYKFLLKREKNKADVQSRIFFEAQKYDFVLKRGLIFFQMVILARLFRRSPTLWKSTLKITTLFRHVQFNVEIHNIVSCSALQISTLTCTTLFQRWFDVVWCCDLISNLKTTLNWRWNVCWEVLHLIFPPLLFKPMRSYV